MLINHIRSAFLDYFKEQGHEIVPSSALIPHNDPTLMFTNAGMVQFKDVFTGKENRAYTRASTSQKCVRAGGKHNDLDNVGYTARHHTFFEMLGNFSFGDYFKEEAIPYAWECLTKTFGLPADKLWITIYHDDEEAYKIWKKVTGFADERIIRIATSDNFWAMGDTGPCGPCSEIFYDHGPDIPGGLPGTPEEDGDRFIEIWNLVFMQYETLASGERIDLPKPSIDTGMGLERIGTVLQGVHNNYDTDLFQNIISNAHDIMPLGNKGEISSYRVVADHIRSISFLIADGVMPSNEGRGYVLRRIMRRAMRHCMQLGAKEPVLFQLVSSLTGQMKDAFPELNRAESLITEIIKLEEERFGDTLRRGLKVLEEDISGISAGGILPGKEAFKLYDTYGFPLDLTVDILRNKEIKVDQNGFDSAMAEQKARAKAAWKGSGEQATDAMWFEIQEQHGSTEFLGYKTPEAQAEIIALLQDGKAVEAIEAGQSAQMVLNQTPCYGESGGQEGDRGQFHTEDAKGIITNTTKALGAIHIHHITVEKATLKQGQIITLSIDETRRQKLRNNHSATHILHAVLRNILGDHVTQKGSLVAEDRLRFDFSHPKALSREEIEEIEKEVNRIIWQNNEVSTALMPPEDAIKAGALALFGEKYGEEVRVVSMGEETPNSSYSVELCGGTHVTRTGDIGAFKIIDESAIAAGIRRVEAITADDVLHYAQTLQHQLASLANTLKTSQGDLENRITALLEERKSLKNECSDLKRKLASGGGSGGGSNIEKLGDIAFIGQHMGEIPPKELRGLATDLHKQLGSGIVAVAGAFEGKSSFIILVSEDLTGNYNAVEMIQQITEIVGAKGGGGKPHFAQTGGTETDRLAEAIDTIRNSITAKA